MAIALTDVFTHLLPKSALTPCPDQMTHVVTGSADEADGLLARAYLSDGHVPMPWCDPPTSGKAGSY